MHYSIVIPARLQSSRLPNKMLLPLDRAPVIEWTWRAALKCNAKSVIIATDDQQIAQHMKPLGAKVIMTSPQHESGTDRISEVSQICKFSDEEIIVNWQGDEPFLPPTLIELVANTLQEKPQAAMSTLATPLTQWEEVYNPNIVKLTHDHENLALYFSRAPIPFLRDSMLKEGALPAQHPFLRHIGLYAYRADFLNRYPALQPSALENFEKLEQLRALDNGFKIAVAHTDSMPPSGIDTAEDLEKANAWIREYNLTP